MTELAKTHISIVDESYSGVGSSTIIPLYVFATIQDKVLDSATGEIATGTTKALANEVSIVTSRKDVVDKFGVPNFVELNGTILQGDERNEYGLYALYDAMGSTSVAYALRADIDLAQLESKEEEPTSKAANGTKWIDSDNSSFGVFVAKETSTKPTRWESKDVVVLSATTDTPINGGFGVILSEDTMTYYEGTSTAWVEIGSSSWTALHSGAKLFIGTSSLYPTTGAAGSVWIKTNNVLSGIDFDLKKYVAGTDNWKELNASVSNSFYEVERNYGASLTDGSIAAFYSLTDASTKEASSAKLMFKKFVTTSKVVADAASAATFTTGGTLKVSSLINGLPKSAEITIAASTTATAVVTALNTAMASNLPGFVATLTDGKITITETGTSAFDISGTAVTQAGFTSTSFGSWTAEKTIKLSDTEPTSAATEGTLWFNADKTVDFMYNDGETGKWKDYKATYGTGSVVVATEEPTESLVNGMIWVNSAAENYPEIHVYDSTALEWRLVDNTDQSSPFGVVFADARGQIVESDPYYVDPDCIDPLSYPNGILLFNTRLSKNNVKEYKNDPFDGMYSETATYTVGNYTGSKTTVDAGKIHWVTASGNAADGSGLFGSRAQRKMVTNALASAIVSNEDIRSIDYDFFFATCPGYPELDDELINLNTDKKEMFEIISDTPATLVPTGNAIQAWATNANNAASHGLDGRILKNEYVTRQYPSMGLASNADGSEVAVPTSVSTMKQLLTLTRGQIAAGTQNGQVTNLASVGYITDEGEYAPVSISEGLGEICVAQSINPLMTRRNTGLLRWGEMTENSNQDSILSREHGIITLLRLKRDLETAVQPYFFKINNESTRNDFTISLTKVLTTYVSSGEIYDFAVVTDESVNTAERINNNELWADIAIEIARGIEQIYLPIRIVATGSLS